MLSEDFVDILELFVNSVFVKYYYNPSDQTTFLYTNQSLTDLVDCLM